MVFALLAALSSLASAEEELVETVTISIKSSDNPPPDQVEKRMENSVATVGENVLVGRKVRDVLESKSSYEKLIREVFDRVLVGYLVQKVEVTPGPVTRIDVLISPSGDVVREVRLDVDYGAMAPEVVQLIRQDMGDIEERIRGVLVGMPVDSIDWAGGVSKSLIREVLANQLPEYRSNIDVVAGSSTVVKLSLSPIGPTVQDIKINLRSQSIPNILLLEARPAVEASANVLQGVPVAFLERHSDYFSKLMMSSVAKRPIVKRFGLVLSSKISAAAATEVFVNVETTKYKITLEGWLDMGRPEDNTTARLHIGQAIDDRDELYVESTVLPASVTWDIAPGWGHNWGGGTATGFKFDINHSNEILWLNQNIGHNWSYRIERTPAIGYTEAGLRYKIDDYISVEYVFSSRQKWLRLVGNL